jgi:hypothetical protein
MKSKTAFTIFSAGLVLFGFLILLQTTDITSSAIGGAMILAGAVIGTYHIEKK